MKFERNGNKEKFFMKKYLLVVREDLFQLIIDIENKF